MIVSASLFHHFHVALLGDSVFFLTLSHTVPLEESDKGQWRDKGSEEVQREEEEKEEEDKEEGRVRAKRKRERCLCRVSFTPPAHVVLCEPLAYFSLLHFLWHTLTLTWRTHTFISTWTLESLPSPTHTLQPFLCAREPADTAVKCQLREHAWPHTTWRL